MKLTTAAGELTLPKNFSFELELKNPFFSEEGAATIPAEIPATNENLSILGYPNRLGKSGRTLRKHTAMLSHGIYAMDGSLIVGSADSDAISCSFATNESLLYSELQEKTLKEIFADKKRYIIAPETWMWETCTRSRTVEDSGGLSVFPVRVTKDDFGFQMLNDPNSDRDGFIYEKRTLTDKDGNKMNLPLRYGLTPFLQLYALIDLAFEFCGYEIEYNVFREYPYEDLTILNNTADACCVHNTIFLTDLVPDITFGDFIIWLKDKFGAVVSYDGKKVSVRLIEKLIASDPDMDLTPYVRNGESLTFQPTSRVIIDCDKSIEGAEPPADQSIDVYIASKKLKSIVKYPVDSLDDILDYGPNDDPVLIKRSGSIVNIYLELSAGVQSLGSAAFKYDRGETEDSDERNAKDRYVPVIVNETRKLITPLIGDAIHHHTSAGEKESSSEDQAIQICWRLWDGELGRYYGSTQPYTFSGAEHPSHFPLTPDGLYHHFWKEYNRILLSGATEISVQIDFPMDKLLSLDTLKPKMYRGQRVMIKALTIEIRDNGIRCSKCDMVVIPPSNVYIEDKDIYSRSSLTWRYVGVEDMGFSENVDVTPTDGLTDYTEAPPELPEWPDYLGEIIHRRLRTGIVSEIDQPDMDTSWYEYYLAVLKK